MRKIKEKYLDLPYFYKLELLSGFVCSVFLSFTAATTTCLIYSNILEKTYSFRLLFSSAMGILFSYAWLVKQDKLYDKFILMSWIEILAYGACIAYVLVFRNFDIYLLSSMVVGTFVSNLTYGAQSKIHQKITSNEQYRTDYDYFNGLCSRVGSVLGAAVALSGLVNGSSEVGIFIAFIGVFISVTFDNFISMYIYKRLN